MSDIVTVAVVVAASGLVTGVAGPMLLARQTNRQRTVEKAEDRRILAENAHQASEAADAILLSNERVAAAASATAEKQNTKLDVIHILTNSTLSAAKEAQLLALEQTLELLHREQPPDPEATAVVQSKVEALRVEVAERARQDALASEVAKSAPEAVLPPA